MMKRRIDAEVKTEQGKQKLKILDKGKGKQRKEKGEVMYSWK